MTQLPQYIQQLGVTSSQGARISTAEGATSQRASQQFTQMAQLTQAQARRVAELNMSTEIRKNIAELGRKYQADPAALQKAVNSYQQGLVSSGDDVFNAQIKAEIQSVSQPYINHSFSVMQRNQTQEHQLAVAQSSQVMFNDLQTLSGQAFSVIPEERVSAQEQITDRFNRVAQLAQEKAPDGTYLLNAHQQMQMMQNATLSVMSGLKPQQQMEAIRPSGGFDRSIAVVLNNEGGLVESDGASGAPAIYGINRKWHEQAFDEAERITAEQGEAAGKAYAATFYKQEYWDKKGIENLRPDQQAIVFDGVINHSSDFADKLLQAAREGAGPSRLLDMRQQEYDRLVKSKPEVYAQSARGWSNRLSSFSAYTLHDSLQLLPPDQKMAIEKAAIKQIEQDRALMVNDYGKWGEVNGYTPDQLKAMAPNPNTASVLPNDKAKVLVDQMKQANTLENLAQMGQALASEMPNSFGNAVRDLRRNGLTREHESALMIMQQAPQYYQQAQDLFTFAQTGSSILDAQMKDLGLKPSEIREAVVERFADEGMDRIFAYEVPRADAARYVEDKKESAVALAKMYMFRNPDASTDEAVDYAYRIESDSYTIGDVNGMKIKIPKNNIADMAYTERRLEQFLNEFAQRAAPNSRFNKAVVPILNQTEDGYYFLNPMEGLVADGNEPLTVTFDELGQLPAFAPEVGMGIDDMLEELKKLEPKPKKPKMTIDEFMD